MRSEANTRWGTRIFSGQTLPVVSFTEGKRSVCHVILFSMREEEIIGEGGKKLHQTTAWRA